MNRHGHLSFKVPNVKLRPAPAASSTSSKRRKTQTEDVGRSAMDDEILQQAWEGAEDEEASTAALRNTTKPWTGIVITFTGVEDKPHLTELAKQLGALVENALTVSVTHVVAAGYGSAKYLYAVEHRLPVLSPSWIAVSHDNWVHGKDLDVQGDIEAHRLAPFLDLRIAISGIEPLDRRRKIMHYIEQLGGIYSKDLDRQCTHLVSSRPANDKPSEKIKWALGEIASRAAKVRAGKKLEGEDIKLVYEEWIWDCVGYRGRWKEDYYDIRKARRNGRTSPEDVINGLYDNLSAEPGAGPSKLKEATTTDNEPAAVRKKKREGMPSLVDELISVTGIKTETSSITELKHQTTSRDPSPPPVGAPPVVRVIDNSTAPLPDDKTGVSNQAETKKSSMLHVSRSNSFAIALPAPANFLTLPSSAVVPPAASRPTDSEPARAQQVVSAPSKTPIDFFANLKFSHVITEQKAGLEKALLDHGAILVSEEDRKQGEEVDYVVARLSSTKKPWMPTSGKLPQVVTECWIEGCYFEQTLLNPDDHIVFRLLSVPTPLPNASKTLVHISGFSAENSVYLRRLLRALGCVQSPSLNRKSTHLICAAPSGLKYQKAQEWGVSVVKDTWLLAAAKSGQLEPEDEHRHDTSGDANLIAPSRPLSRPRADTVSNSNMSHMSELGSGIIDPSIIRPRANEQPRSPVKPVSQIKVESQQNSSISPSRMLKLTPTHVDDLSKTSLSGDGNGSTTSISMTGYPLSPPKAEAARRLNTLHVEKFNQSGMVDEMKSSSAPAQPESAERFKATGSGKALTVGDGIVVGSGDTDVKKNTDMMSALRKLAESKDSGGEERRKQRPSRPGSRIKATVSTSPSSRLGSAPPISPQPASPTKSRRPITAPTEYVQIDGDESIHVKYVDQNAEKEKKRLKDALRRSENSGRAAVGGLVGLEASPSKRRKR